MTNASANLLVVLTKFGVTPQLGLQRHLASNGAPKGFQGVPNVSKRIRKITRAIVNINDGKRKIDFLTLFYDFLRSITRAIVNKHVGKREIDLLRLF